MTRSGELEERKLLRQLEAELRAKRRCEAQNAEVAAANARARVDEVLGRLDQLRRGG
jgi:hypothetical protein